MSSVGPKQHVFASLAQIAQALGHAHRLELLEHLGQGERSVEDLAARAKLTLANTSRHLQLLRRAALVVGRRDGKRVYYRLAGDDVVVGLLTALSRVGERNSAEIARVMASYFRARDEFEPVSRDELLGRLRSGTAAVLDVRPEDEFANGHLPAALNIPLAQLERRLAELPAGAGNRRLLPGPLVRPLVRGSCAAASARLPRTTAGRWVSRVEDSRGCRSDKQPWRDQQPVRRGRRRLDTIALS